MQEEKPLKRNSLTQYKILLITLITSLLITGISFLDNKIWNIVMLIVGMLAYGMVGIQYSLHIIVGKQEGKDAFAATVIVLIILGVFVYNGIIEFQRWICSWALWIKIVVPTIMGILLIGIITMLIFCRKKK